MDKSPRIVHSEKTICAPNKYFYVTEKDMSSENQSHYKANVIHFNPGTQVLVIDQDDNIYMNREYRLAVEEYSIECPGGAVEEGEEPLVAAQRELKEELGITAQNRKQIAVLRPSKGFLVDTKYLFLAEIDTIGETNLDAAEHIERMKLPLQRAYERTKQGKIDEPCSCYLIHEAYIRNILIP